jgi:DNA-binding NtrC family response regulator
MEMQVKLLRALQEGEIRRVGGTESISVDFRLLSATNRDLQENVEKGTFRSDLFFRINVMTLQLPALRDRQEDILLLANHFLKTYTAQYGFSSKVLGKGAEKALLTYSWPGNVRELENRLHKSVILSRRELLKPADLGFENPDKQEFKEGMSGWKSLKDAREAAEKECIIQCMRQFRGNISRTSVALNVDRKVLTRMIERLGIEPKKYRQG